MFHEKVRLESLKDGAVLEVGNKILPEIIENFYDEETDFYEKRKLILEIEFKASKVIENLIHVSVKADRKLAPKIVDGGVCRRGTEDGELGLFSETGEQLDMLNDKVRSIRIEGQA